MYLELWYSCQFMTLMFLIDLRVKNFALQSEFRVFEQWNGLFQKADEIELWVCGPSKNSGSPVEDLGKIPPPHHPPPPLMAGLLVI